jgi:predicted TIM-barrel fold metal-dependent hydrolase
MDYIDSHVHVWSDDFARYPLTPRVTVEDMESRRFLPDEILAVARPSGVSRIVLVQMSYYGTDNRYMLDVIKGAPETFRGIAVIDHLSPDCHAEMRHLAAAGVRGFRISQGVHDPASWLQTGAYDCIFEGAAREGLAVCPLIDPGALTDLAKICSRFPATPIVIDHMARIGMAAPIQKDQIEQLCEIAHFPEVRVKVSAFYALGNKRPPHLDLADLVQRLCETYGPRRLLWGSDCPFQLASESYEDSIALVRDRLPFLSSEDRQWLLCRTTEEIFFS